MVAIAQFELESEAIPLQRLFVNYPEATVELERVVPLQSRVIPYFWVSGVSGIDLDDAFESGQGIERLQLVDELDGRTLVRIEWAENHDGLTHAIEQAEITLLSAIGTADGWQIEVRGDEHDSISQFHELCTDMGIPTRLVNIYHLTSETHEDTTGLSDPQKEALRLAYEHGYYDIPRTTNLATLAEQIGISRQAVSNRLKRGTRRLIENSLLSDTSHD